MNQRNRHDADAERGAELVHDDPPMAPDEDQVLIRMYGQGVGDCFLLAIPRTRTTSAVAKVSNGRPVFILIDCGVTAEPGRAAERMRRVVSDIRETTRDPTLPDRYGSPPGHLDLLIVTNGNPDHIAGFTAARKVWEGIQVDALWTSWAEGDGADEVASALRRITARQQRALSRIADKATSPELDDRLRIAARIATVLKPVQASEEECASETRAETAIGTIASERVERRQWITSEPGDVRRVPGTTALAYVLGPPRDWDRLLPISPKKRQSAADGKQQAGSEKGKADAGNSREKPAVDLAAPFRRYVDEPSALNAVVAPLLAPGLLGLDRSASETEQADRDVYERTFPFDRRQRIPLPSAEAAAAAYPDAYRALTSYFDEVSHWRRIDYDWLAAADSFALQVDNLINNTSLALAIELPPGDDGVDAKVLLFASDAQAGNWMSWDDIPAWQPRNGARPSQPHIAIAELLRRTTFYKVGHHGANNATPRELGLDRMCTDGALTAFVPATTPDASGERWPNLPQREVMDALSARAGGRVVLADGTVWGSEEPPADVRRRLGVVASRDTLPEELDEEGNLIIAERPLWVQMAIDY